MAAPGGGGHLDREFSEFDGFAMNGGGKAHAVSNWQESCGLTRGAGCAKGGSSRAFSAAGLDDALPSPRHALVGSEVRRLERNIHVMPRVEEEGHVDQGVTDGDGLDVAGDRAGRDVGGKGERLAGRRSV